MFENVGRYTQTAAIVSLAVAIVSIVPMYRKRYAETPDQFERGPLAPVPKTTVAALQSLGSSHGGGGGFPVIWAPQFEIESLRGDDTGATVRGLLFVQIVQRIEQ